MKRLIYQVAVGNRSDLYEHCISSAKQYAESIGADHIVQRQPKLRVVPNVFTNGRSCPKTSGWKKLGYLPIFEKENAFELLSDYDQILILDADIYVRPGSPNIFDELGEEYAFGGVAEMDMPITQEHSRKIRQYSIMQYQKVANNLNWVSNKVCGFEFYNMGLMLLNSKKIIPALRGQTPMQFLERPEFREMLDGVGAYKWSTDQTMLNYWVRKEGLPCKNLDWKWNALYGSLKPESEKTAHFIHFYLKDKLPERGENVPALMEKI